MKKEFKCIGFANKKAELHLYNTIENRFDNCAYINVDFEKYKDASLLDAQICMTLNDIDKVKDLTEIVIEF
jgi:hypothetical protein